MNEVILQLLTLFGLDGTTPQTMSELIPFVLQVAVRIGLFGAVVGMMRSIMNGIINRKMRV